jgi:alkanesulfonate monooxygenase SsuD/methylene tetrahydromethanopterin reductase-like flavin-dependent oxidoreductase (luciferase family)
LRYKLAKYPAFVKQMLADAAKSPDQIDTLTNVAGQAMSSDPDLASLALDFASKMIMQVEPLSKRATAMQSLIQGYQRCDGEVDAGLMQEAMVVVQQLRQEQNNAANPVPSARGRLTGARTTVADQLEMAIVAEQALDDFSGAMKYLQPMSDEKRLEALLRIVETLLQSSY